MAGTHANGTGDPKRHQSDQGRGIRFRRLRVGLTISIFTLVGLTLCGEAWLRVTDYREHALASGVNRTNRRWMALLAAGIFEEVDDPVRHYAMRPGAEAVVDGWTFRTTSHRTRGPEFPREKPPGERRIVCLGDSFAFGLWADEEQTLVGHLARMANDAEEARGGTDRWRAIDLGVPGYHTGQQLASLEAEGLELDPDVVVLYYNTNDIVAEGMYLSEELGALYSDHLPMLSVGLKRFLWRHSCVYGWITQAYSRSYASLPSPHLDPRVPWAHVRKDNQDATAASIRRIAELCRERGVPLFWVDQPLVTWGGDYHRADWPGLALVAWAEELRAELGIAGVSLLPSFRGYADNVDRFPAPPDERFLLERYIADEVVQEGVRAFLAGEPPVEPPADPDFHFTGAGYGWIAETCYPALKSAGMLP